MPETMMSFTLTSAFLLTYLACIVASYTPLTNATLTHLPSPGNDFDINKGALLAPILRVRVPGTKEIEEVRHHFVKFFRQNLPQWELTWQNSTQSTALGPKPVTFSNIILTRDPPWTRPGDVGRLTLVAHYDSKLTPEGFIGATDSAAPCAMLMHVARSIDGALTRKWKAMVENGEAGLAGEQGIQILFLDGEEAFVNWSATDSLYGSRALAAEWDRTVNPAMSTFKTNISSIELFVLLDLLGAKNPSIPSYFATTHWAYLALARLESRMRSLRLVKSSPNHANGQSSGSRPVREPMFMVDANKDSRSGFFGVIEDDHVPFLQRGVEILHLIPSPFPTVWHTIQDDGQHLHLPTVEDWAQMTTAFAAEWMDLEGFMPMGESGAPSAIPRAMAIGNSQDETRIVGIFGDHNEFSLY